MPRCGLTCRIGADEEEPPVGIRRVAGPDLLAVDDPLVAHEFGRVLRFARSEPAPGSEKPWHQNSSPRQDLRREARALLLGAEGEQHRRQHVRRLPAEVGRICAIELFEEDVLAQRRPVRAAPSHRPVRRAPALVGEDALPAAVEFGSRVVPATESSAISRGRLSRMNVRTSCRNASSAAVNLRSIMYRPSWLGSRVAERAFRLSGHRLTPARPAA